MRTSDIARVPNGVYNPPPPKEWPPVNEMSMSDLKDSKQLCSRAQQDVTTCLNCKGMCGAGYRVIELLEE